MLDENGFNLLGTLLCRLLDCFQGQTGRPVVVMNFDQNFQSNLLNDVLSRLFGDIRDLVHFVQTRAGKYDSSIIASYWLGQEHMINDKTTLSAYVKFECGR